MLFTKSQFIIHMIASQDSFDRGLNSVHFCEDGSAVAGNGKMLIAVSPCDETKINFPDIGEQTEPGPGGVSVRLETIKKVIKNIPNDKRATSQYVAMSIPRNKGNVEFTILDSRDYIKVSGEMKYEQFPDWKQAIKNLYDENATKVCVNRTDLRDLLNVIEAACPDKSGLSPVYLEIDNEGKGILLRAQNYQTGQQIIAAINAYNTKGIWIQSISWIKNIFSKLIKKKKIK